MPDEELRENKPVDQRASRRAVVLGRLPSPAVPIGFAAWGVLAIAVASSGGWPGLIGAAVLLALGVALVVWLSSVA
ncbi:MAG: hypothetical protein ACRDN9_16765 [Streptosporangiaceae bacterium]